MTTPEQPDWLKNHIAQHGAQRPTRGGFMPGVSGNPAGRPKGSKDKKTLVAQEFEKEGSAVAAVVIEKAKGGDMTAANIVLQRISPPLKSRGERVQFSLDAQAPLTEQGRQILMAVAEAQIDPDTGKLLIECLCSFAGLMQVDELSERLAALEGKTP